MKHLLGYVLPVSTLIASGIAYSGVELAAYFATALSVLILIPTALVFVIFMASDGSGKIDPMLAAIEVMINGTSACLLILGGWHIASIVLMISILMDALIVTM